MKQTIKRKIHERAIETELVRRVKAAGGMCEKTRVIGKRGWPDRFCALPGAVIILAETKRPIGGRLSVHQKKYRDELAALGIAVAIIKNEADIDRLLHQASSEKKRATTR